MIKKPTLNRLSFAALSPKKPSVPDGKPRHLRERYASRCARCTARTPNPGSRLVTTGDADQSQKRVRIRHRKGRGSATDQGAVHSQHRGSKGFGPIPGCRGPTVLTCLGSRILGSMEASQPWHLQTTRRAPAEAAGGHS